MKPHIKTSKNGPLVLDGLGQITQSVGTDAATDKKAIALCRCGKSKTKPYCDGTHGKIGWTDAKSDDRAPRRVDHYIGAQITIHDDRGICSHAGYCTDGLPEVFRQGVEPWIEPDAVSVNKIIETIRKCPSGALSYTIDGVHYDHYHDKPAVTLREDGPYDVTGEIALEDDDHPRSTEHYTLCRCGKSKNKPFCSGQHWYVKFKDDGTVKDEPDEDCCCSRESYDNKLETIRRLAETGQSKHRSMRTERPFIGWETILFKNAQLASLPLESDVDVRTQTVIGPEARQPLVIDLPFYVSHMSYGAISKEAKIALAKGSAAVGTAACSGEGGLLDESRRAARHMIYELGPGAFTQNEQSIRRADAVEIKIGQAAKPGYGGALPAYKVTPEIAAFRGMAPGQPAATPARVYDVDSLEDLVRLVDWVRMLTDGKPVGIKIAAGHLEDDLSRALTASPDFITIDCRGGATGSAPLFIKDNVGIPPIYAIRRARRFLDEAGSAATLCVTGGFRDSTDIAKALALGADAVALATASLISVGCIQSKVCHTGKCPVGIATQDPVLRSLFDEERAVRGFVSFYDATTRELKALARCNGKNDVHQLDLSDVMTTSEDVARYTDIAHV